MTFSICAREQYDTEDGTETRYGVAVTTRRPAVGARCPFVNEFGAIATQSYSNERIGKKGIQYLKDGLEIDDALSALLNADQGSQKRQVHGVDHSGEFVFTGSECRDWCGHNAGDNYTVAGNILTGEEVLTSTGQRFESIDSDKTLPLRLIESLKAGHEVGGDKRDREIQSAVVRVRSTEELNPRPFIYDLRVDASKEPIDDLLKCYELTIEGNQN